MTDTPLTMLQFQPDPYRASAWMVAHGVTRPGHDDGYGWHALFTAAFGDLAPKPFRVVEAKGKPLLVLAYTAATVAGLRDHAAAFATPAVVAALALETDLTGKRMPDRFEAGQHFGFEVRVRPTVRQDRDGDRTTSREKDAFLAALDHLPQRGDRLDIAREDVYRQWLSDRIAPAAKLGHAGVSQLSRTILLRRGVNKSASPGKPDSPARDLFAVNGREKHKAANVSNAQEGGGGPDAVFSGTLTIKDPAAFRVLLARGVGRHRSFGFGMLLLRPARPEAR